MADCFPFPPESDDLHRRWLPREIFADIGIADPDSAAAEPTPEAVVEELAAQLAGILGGGGGGGANKVWPLAPPSPPVSPPPAAAAPAPCHAAKVCGLEGNVAMTCAGTNGGGGALAAVTWPFVPYPQFQWQVGGSSGLVNHGGVLDCYSVLPPALPCHVPPPPANLRTGGGTGVFLPRVEAYHRYSPAATAPSPPVKGGAWTPAAKPWAGAGTGTGSRPPTAKKQPPQNEHATPTKQQHQKQPQATTGAALALPQDWSYR